MKNHIELTSPVAPEIPTGEYLMEQKELAAKLEQTNRTCQRLEEENRFLQEQISLQTSSDDDRDKIVNRWKDDYSAMRTKVAEKSYLEELLEEKKAQISFLQNQLEQRIRSQHQAEHQRQLVLDEMQQQKDLFNDFSQQKEDLKNQIALLENIMRETKQQNELLNAEVADKKDLLTVLQQQLTDEQSRLQFVEQRLTANKQVLRRLYKEFSACMEEEGEKSLVVEFRQNNRIEGTGNEKAAAVYPL